MFSCLFIEFGVICIYIDAVFVQRHILFACDIQCFHNLALNCANEIKCEIVDSSIVNNLFDTNLQAAICHRVRTTHSRFCFHLEFLNLKQLFPVNWRSATEKKHTRSSSTHSNLNQISCVQLFCGQQLTEFRGMRTSSSNWTVHVRQWCAILEKTTRAIFRCFESNQLKWIPVIDTHAHCTWRFPCKSMEIKLLMTPVVIAFFNEYNKMS